MGVPALFRWLSRKYPKIVSSVIEGEDANAIDPETGVSPFDMSLPNPNGEADCLYLDMNGIVHPCTHPEGKKAPETEQEMMVEIFKYTERVVNMIRPRQLLFLAIDGVAPRAKMNQQRSRRFRAAQEARIKEEERQEAILEWQARGRPMTEDFTKEKAWDSNAITPGTPFMDLLAQCLKYWIVKKMNTSRGWQNLQVIISDASVPGEGEHKIMDFIRRQRSHPEHNPNTRHVIYGLDADLIMLSLATHEPHFRVLREDVFAQGNKPRGCHRCGEPGHHSSMCTAPPKAREASASDALKPFIFLDVAVLREYLEIELNLPGLSFPFEFERAIDDWVFLIFFVGNDFLPHLPSLEIREGAIDTLIHIWRAALPRLQGYVTEHGQVHLERLQEILTGLSGREDGIFAKRREAEERQDQNAKRRRVEATGEADYVQVKPMQQEPPPLQIDREAVKEANMSAAQKLKRELLGLPPAQDATPTNGTDMQGPRGTKRTADEADLAANLRDANVVAVDSTEVSDEADASISLVESSPQKHVPPPIRMLGENMAEQEDVVKLWEPGYRERYYRQKFGVELSVTEFRRSLVKSYVEGLCWVLAYYYQGCPSWQWFYPQHFSPFAADFEDLASLDIKFELGTPFKPFEQLMGVFPADSRQHIPTAYHGLMIDDDSPLKDFYPSDFHIDMNGKKMLWQGVALLPFIGQERLQNALSPLSKQLTEDEHARNAPGADHMYSHEDSALYNQLSRVYADSSEAFIPLKVSRSCPLLGFVKRDPDFIPNSTFFSPLSAIEGQIDIDNDRSLSTIYQFPEQIKPHRSILLPGAKPQRGALTSHDLDMTRRGNDGSTRPTSSFHGSRRDIDGIGVRRPNNPQYQNEFPQRPQSTYDARLVGHNGGTDPYADYGYGGTRDQQLGRNSAQPYARPSQYIPPPAPVLNLPRQPAMTYQQPYQPQPLQSGYMPPQLPNGYMPPVQPIYQQYGMQPQYQQPNQQGFNNQQAMMRNLPPHLQQQAQPAQQPYGSSYRR